ncbi:MAG: ATP-dependent DNA helicase DinG, partial [Spirochaetaceae bacterium]|nr:ATP-dependent DNA helicase DinG [Spirochaetaceae bacterium]
KRFTGSCLETLRGEIAGAGGNEVLALGYLDDEGLVARIRVTARGTDREVLALITEDEGSPDVFIHNHPSGFLTPSDNDLAIAGRAAEGGIGAFIVDNQVGEVYVVAEPVRRRKTRALEADQLCASLQEGGEIAKRLVSFEVRESQLDMMRLVIRGFNDNEVVLCEAGTGVGKSFAYLLPALRFALDNDERIVISTATITLQQQLFDKDIPLVQAALGSAGKKLKAALMKGRGNYLCRRRMDEALKEQGLDEGETEELHRIAAWAETSKSGSRSDLSFSPQEGIWSRLSSEADLCMGMRCPWRERCFVLSLRREAADARILVVNHHLLFADLAARREGAGYDNTVVLPPYTRMILDEAHSIEGAATSFFSDEFSRLSILRQLGRLYRRRQARRLGLLLKIPGLGKKEEKLDELVEAIERIREIAGDLDQAALGICGEEGVFRLNPLRDMDRNLPSLLIALRKGINHLGNLIRDLLEEIPKEDRDDPALWEIAAILRRLEGICAVCDAFVEYRERPREVIWLERRGGGRGDSWAAFTVTPIEVATGLKESLFDPGRTVICCSATLTIAGRFDYWETRCGLKLMEDPPLRGIFPSPFPYSSSVLLAIPRDAPLPEEPGYQDFVNRAVAALILAGGGSTLALFTSYQSLKSAYAAAAPLLSKEGIRCLKQGDDDRSRLLADFLKDTSSVLFATDSFWEGVDAPGDTLRLVILARLPFRTPNDPVFEARREYLEMGGGNAFMDLSLPEAVMKFKQGFGRLMRRSSDRGVVAVLDSRAVKKRYGEFFLRSLPETRTSFAEFGNLLLDTERFLYSR